MDDFEHLLDDSITATSFSSEAATAPFPDRARIVVIGAGIVGASTAMHLAEAGETDVVLLERARVSSGTSWHAAGLVARQRGSHAMTELANYGVERYSLLEEQMGIPIGFNPCGSLTIARTPGRVDECRAMGQMCTHHGIDARMLSPEELTDVWPIASPDGVLASLHQPNDGQLNPGWATLAMAKAAHDAGVTIREGVRVTGLQVEGGSGGHFPRVTGVFTNEGTIEAERVVLTCGIWTRELAAAAGVSVPLYAAKHVHVTTKEKIEGSVPSLPTFRDLDQYLYIRHNRGRLTVGAFEPDGRPISMDDIAPDFAFGEFEPDWEHFQPVKEGAERAVPALRDATFDRFLYAPEAFTPDVNFCLGEAAEVAGLFIGAGFNSQGIIYAPGAGRALAEWVLEGAPTFDASAVDVRRFSRAQSNRRYLHERTKESLGRLYAMHWPYLQSDAARDVRRTPLYDRLMAAGGCFGEANGWERPGWYAREGQEPRTEYSYGRQNWFDNRAEEHRAAREGVAFFDLSSFAKTEVAGPDALSVLQRVCTADVALDVGQVAYTLMLNSRGGIELDGTVVRLESDRFMVITPTVTDHMTYWLFRRAVAGTDATVFDATSGTAVLHIAGPRSAALLQRLTTADVDGLRRFRGQEMDIANAVGLVLRVSFTGEQGFEIYVPTDYALGVYDALVEAGSDLGLKHAGLYALDSLRTEVGYRHLGHDIGPTDDPFQAGLDAFVSFDKASDFVGKQALADRRNEIPDRRQVFIQLDDPEPLLYHAESLLKGDRYVGEVTSGSYGHTLGASVGLGYVDAATAAEIASGDTACEIDIMLERHPATLSLEPLLKR